MDMQNVIRDYLPSIYWTMPGRPFMQQVEYNPLLASAQAVPGTFTVDSGQHFVVTHLSEIITTDVAGGTEQAFPEHLVMIANQSSGESWTASQFQHAANVFGRSPVLGRPTPLPRPQLVKGGQTVQVLTTNMEATDRRIWMMFAGILLTES